MIKPKENLSFLYISIAASSLYCFYFSAQAQTYTYDELGRVKAVAYSSKETKYDYDAADNRTSIITKGSSSSSSGSNTFPVCTSPTYTITGVPSAVPAPITLTQSSLIALCTDANGDALAVTSPIVPYSITISTGQTKTIPYSVSDGKGGTGNGIVTYKRP